MTIRRVVDVGTATAQAAIDAASEAPGDKDGVLLRVAVVELLRTHADGLSDDGDDAALLKAYQDWLEIAVALYTTGDEALVDEYTNRATVLQREMDKAAGRAGAGAS